MSKKENLINIVKSYGWFIVILIPCIVLFAMYKVQSPANTAGVGYLYYTIFLAVGVLLLVKGADYFVDGASAIARKLHISPLVVGLTVVSFGTSAPELAVSLTSSLQGNSGIALGNVVGSNIMNLLIVLGLSSIVTPIVVKKSLTKREFPFLIVATVLLMIFSMDILFDGYSKENVVSNVLSRGEALIFLFGIIAFCYISIVMAKKDAKKESLEMGYSDNVAPAKEEEEDFPVWKAIFLLLIGLGGIVVGAEFVTTPATVIATSLGSAAGLDPKLVVNVVGLTVVAIGTSLPELVTSMIAARKGENEIAIGNVVGSNIFNILFICGLSGIILPLTMTADIITDMVISFGVTLLVFYFARSGRISRKAGGILVGVYCIYLTYILVRLWFPQIAIPFDFTILNQIRG